MVQDQQKSEEKDQVVGLFRLRRRPIPYEVFMEEQRIPIVRGVGVRDLRDVTLAPWKRMGGSGAFLDLDGLAGKQGMYLLEIPPGGASTVERHLYEEMFYVVEGRGTTEIWVDEHAENRKQVFEWSAGALFTAPLNTHHRLINASSTPALILGVTNAPPIMTLYRSEKFVFNTNFHFDDRYNPDDPEFFKPTAGLGIDPDNERAHYYSNLVPDVRTADLAVDGQRGPGYRRFSWRLAGNHFFGFVASYPPGRYSMCHAHDSGPVLLCLQGQGYSITWPRSAGTRPWEEGKGHVVKRQDYVPGGVVSAAPGDANWFHGHYGTGKDGLRVLAFLGGFVRPVRGAVGEEMVAQNADIREGGATIHYRDEDPHIRRMYEEELAKNGGVFDMPEEVYKEGSNVPIVSDM